MNIFDYSQRLIKELFDFYERKMEEINNVINEEQESFEEGEKTQRKPSNFFKPENYNELNIYSQ